MRSTSAPTNHEVLKILAEHAEWRNSFGQRGSRADFSGAYMTGLDLTGHSFKDAILVRAILTNARLVGADFTRANLAYADLRGANVEGAIFKGADLRGANFPQAAAQAAVDAAREARKKENEARRQTREAKWKEWEDKQKAEEQAAEWKRVVEEAKKRRAPLPPKPPPPPPPRRERFPDGESTNAQLYTEVGASYGATKEDVKRAYRQAVFKHHPDRGGDLEKMKRINAARDLLEKRGLASGPKRIIGRVCAVCGKRGGATYSYAHALRLIGIDGDKAHPACVKAALKLKESK